MLTFQEVAEHRVIPVVMIDDADRAVPLGHALLDGGLRTVEITLRTPAALAAIEALAGVPEIRVGAGTVTTPDDVDRVADAGGAFLVGPGQSSAVARRAAERGIPYLPGAATATEIQQAIELGSDVVKFFPAEALGGPAAVTMLGGPFPTLGFVVTGGIDAARMPAYLALPNVLAVGGSFMVNRAWIAAGRFDEVTRATRAALESAAIASAA